MSELTYVNESKKNWYNRAGTNNDNLQTGCLQRIATSLESMAKNHDDLVSSREWYKGRLEAVQYDNTILHRRISALKGVITKLKKKP